MSCGWELGAGRPDMECKTRVDRHSCQLANLVTELAKRLKDIFLSCKGIYCVDLRYICLDSLLESVCTLQHAVHRQKR